MARRSPLEVGDFGPSGHPDDPQLMAEPPSAVVEEHVRTCLSCSTRVPLLRRGRPSPPSVEPDVAHVTWQASIGTTQGWPTLPVPVSAVLSHQPGRLKGWVRELVVLLVQRHQRGRFGGLDAVEPAVAGGRLCLPPATEGNAVHDWQAAGRWLRRWLVLSPVRGLQPLVDELEHGLDDLAVCTRLMELEALFGDVSRYDDRGRIGQGGMGEVLRVRDRTLHRDVAMKVLRDGLRQESQRFIAEAQLTAQLQHPAIVPVLDFGVLPSGQPFYTMKVVEGDTLADKIREVHAVSDTGWGETPDGWSLRRLVDALARACDGMALAHARGVVHRDFKPHNVMVGAFGEVQVMDWGLARAPELPEDPRLRLPTTVETVRHLDDETRAGRVLGTASFMAPEQARGQPVDVRADVFALGASLFHILVGHAPRAALSGEARVAAAAAGEPVPWPETTPPRPALLEDLVRDCMAAEASQRPAEASEVARRLRAWLDGHERTRRATQAVEAVRDLAERAAEQVAQAQALRRQADALLAELPTWAPVQDKRAGWALQDQAEAMEREASVAEVRLEQGLRTALDHDPDHAGALAGIARLYKAALLRAETRRDADAIARLTTLLHDHEGGRHRAWLARGGTVTLITAPAGATVVAHRLEERDRRLVPVHATPLGQTPLRAVPLARGNYVLEVTSPDHAPARYPVLLRRGEHWHGVPPGGTEPEIIPLLPAAALPPDVCHVPSGWFQAGGDEDAGDGLRERRLWCDGFLIQRFAVTHQDYLAYLRALLDAGQVDRALDHTPAKDATGGAQRHYLWDGAQLSLPTPSEVLVDVPITADRPVCSITWEAARSYAAWRAARDGLPWRLPQSMEWEKAAGGVDGRTHPWGSWPEPTWSCTLGAQPGRPQPAPVTAFESDESPYGVRGLAGNVRTWCEDGYHRDGPAGDRVQILDGEGPYRMNRGAAYSSATQQARIRSRYVLPPGRRGLMLGIRLVCSVPW